MKLTPHQEAIVEKIIEGSVYDIPSYLEIFEKGHKHQYNEKEIQSTFQKLESGKTYSFKEKNSYYYTEVFDNNASLIETLPVPNKSTYEFRDYPLLTPVKAELEMNIKPETIIFKEKSYSFNFLNEEIFVADNFDDILDFIALWAYLIQEALVIEVSKPIETKDLSIFFEKTQPDSICQTSPYWKRKRVINPAATPDTLPTLIESLAPYKSASDYILNPLKPNTEHLTWCEKYIGKKLIATSSLRTYSQNKYQTFEEVSQHKNLFIAKVAVVISVISVLIGNIFPLFGKQETDYLNVINQQLTNIESKLNNSTTNQNILVQLNEISSSINNIKIHTDPLNDILNQIEELCELLSKQSTESNSTE